ncbi:MAG: bis(5'-nucleosyl)-tetraphosphatase (symmetrical) YqeK [Lachnospiraceae bacterium]|nr:bis(5'-nucleosyl)-tetraphosphatase (symmetrical) YqeK [Lachnospiraceae bacterium]
MNIKDIKKELKKVLTDKRYEHTLGVAYSAMCLAMVYDTDIKKAELAGLLHDNAKCMSDEKLLKKCKKHGLNMSEIEKEQPYLLHAKLGAFYAGEKYGVCDKDIISAVYYHTTGHPDMTMLEKIIFVADYIEPGRNKAHNLNEIRKLSFSDIDKAVYRITEDTLRYLNNDKRKLDEMTEKTYHYYKNIIENR